MLPQTVLVDMKLRFRSGLGGLHAKYHSSEQKALHGGGALVQSRGTILQIENISHCIFA